MWSFKFDYFDLRFELAQGGELVETFDICDLGIGMFSLAFTCG
jgi:hypothetical protein